jgi:hypothetical protein
VRWVEVGAQVLISIALICIGALGLWGERDRAHLLSIAQATWSPNTRPTADVFDEVLSREAWAHTALASSRDVLTSAAWIATFRAAQLRRSGPIEQSRAADTMATERLTKLIVDGPTHALAWYLIAEHTLATSGFSKEVTTALRLSYVTGRFDLKAAERRVGILARYWPLLKDEFETELKSDVRVMVFGQGYDLANSRLAHIGVREAPAQFQLLRRLLGEIKQDYLYWYDYEANLLRTTDAARKQK